MTSIRLANSRSVGAARRFADMLRTGGAGSDDTRAHVHMHARTRARLHPHLHSHSHSHALKHSLTHALTHACTLAGGRMLTTLGFGENDIGDGGVQVQGGHNYLLMAYAVIAHMFIVLAKMTSATGAPRYPVTITIN